MIFLRFPQYLQKSLRHLQRSTIEMNLRWVRYSWQCQGQQCWAVRDLWGLHGRGVGWTSWLARHCNCRRPPGCAGCVGPGARCGLPRRSEFTAWFSAKALPWGLGMISEYLRYPNDIYKILQDSTSISEHIWAWFCEVNSLPEQFLNWTTLSSLQNVFDQVRVVPSLCPRSWIESCWKASWQTHVGERRWNHSIQSDSTWFNPGERPNFCLVVILWLWHWRHRAAAAPAGPSQVLWCSWHMQRSTNHHSGAFQFRCRDCWDLLGFYSTSHGSFNTWESWVDKFLFWNSSRSAGSNLAHSFPDSRFAVFPMRIGTVSVWCRTLTFSSISLRWNVCDRKTYPSNWHIMSHSLSRRILKFYGGFSSVTFLFFLFISL